LNDPLNRDVLRRDLGLLSAFVVVVANMVGTGIFTTSGFVIKELGNPLAMILCWFVGGIFALSGALCYGELGAIFPRAGGEYVYLRESFGRWMAFLSGWISLIVGFSAPIAAASIAFATYFFHAIPGHQTIELTGSLLGSEVLIINPITLLASAIIVIFSLLHYHSLYVGSRVQNVLTAFKVLLIMGFIGAGLWLGEGSMTNFQETPRIDVVLSENFAMSLVFVSFAYSGWNAAAYLGSEIKNASRNIPVSLFGGALFVMCLYLLLNVVYIYALPVNEMTGVVEVGAKAALALFGANASYYVSGAVAIGLLSVISAMVMIGPRVYYAMATDGVFFRIFGKLRAVHRTPAYSIFLQGAIGLLMVITFSFEKLLFYIGFTISLFAMLTVCGLILLRLKNPHLSAHYRTWGYPVTPLLFISGNLWIIYFSIQGRPMVSLFGLGTIAAGSLVYLAFRLGKTEHRQPM
jgi:APA family basic amino acid/polyamine antiporter